ncbi:hypothetical protein RHMOL_Rhmol11G0153400 [Rhododendron molle]|uniref:Uncharacterized protein n=1 Tax=Rhododendron molle TaxID=49168 RepID=A0ACC0LSN7_RHOML|nr:hypothetical protein RHMOL_Rhmol11G0153400 [Rhododendron molle]
MERGHRGRRGEMDDIYDPYTYRTERRVVEAVTGNGNGHAAAGRMYVVRSKPPPADPYRSLNLSKSPLPPKPVSNSKRGLFCGRELKRRKRVAKYKWYAIEGSVKASLKSGYTWFKRRCSRLVHGV